MPTNSTDTPVASPCIRVCTLDDDDICLGCYRSMPEICAWGRADEPERRHIVKAAELRRSAYCRRA